MKHLQRLPKNEGDNVLLGTLVACGVQPEKGDFFASFDCNGELVTYMITNPNAADFLIDELNERIVRPLIFGKCEFNDLTKRNDMRYECGKVNARFIHVDDPSNFTEVTPQGIQE